MFRIAYFLISLALTSYGTFAQGISMSPTRLFFTGQPGETLRQIVTLSNTSGSDYSFEVSIKDWKREIDGNKVYFDPHTLENSNSSWVSTNESTIIVPAGSTREITVSMVVPKDPVPEKLTNSMLFFTQIGKPLEERQQTKSIGLIALFEFGLHIYYTPPHNNDRSLEILNMEDVQKEKSRQAMVRIKNDGNMVCDAVVGLELTNKNTGEEIQLPEINVSLMPEAEQVVIFNLPDHLKGEYLGIALIQMAGTNDLRVGEKMFEF